MVGKCSRKLGRCRHKGSAAVCKKRRCLRQYSRDSAHGWQPRAVGRPRPRVRTVQTNKTRALRHRITVRNDLDDSPAVFSADIRDFFVVYRSPTLKRAKRSILFVKRTFSHVNTFARLILDGFYRKQEPPPMVSLTPRPSKPFRLSCHLVRNRNFATRFS